MGYLFLVCISIILLMYIIVKKEKKVELIKLMVFSIVFYFFIYIVVCSAFFCVDIFTIKRAVITEFLLLLACACYVYKRSDNKETKIYFCYKDWIWEILAIITVSCFALGSYGLFGMGQDEGVYQQQAIAFMHNITAKEQILPEYEELPEGKYKEYYYENLFPNLMNFDLNYNYNKYGKVPFVTNSPVDSSAGVWHGIPVYSAILALSGKIFGMSHMADIHFIFYIVYLCIIKFICDNLKIDKKCTVFAVLLAGLSPEILWVTKNTLVEIFLSVIVLTYIYFLTTIKNQNRIFSVVPVWIFSLYHVSVYTMMPMFIVVYWALYMWERERKYIQCVYYVLLGYYIGFWDMICLQAGYTLFKNYGRPLRIIPVPLLIPFISGMCLLGILINFLISKYGEYRLINIQDKASLCKKIVSMIVFFCLLIAGIKVITSNQIYDTLCNRTWIMYSVLTGFVILPLVVWKLLIKKFEWNQNTCVMTIMFLWSIAIYATFLKRSATYWYYTRYLSPYLSVIILLFLILYRKKKSTVFILLFACIGIMPLSLLVKNVEDKTRVSWEVTEGILENIKDNDIILMDTDLMYGFYFPIKSVGGLVYPIMNSVEETLEEINTENRPILYLTQYTNCDSEDLYMLQYRQTYQTSEDSGAQRTKFLHLPTLSSYLQGENTVSLYRIMWGQNVYDIDARDNKFMGDGWTPGNIGRNTWISGEEGSCVHVYFQEEDDYKLVFYTGDLVPFEKIDKEYLNVSVYINDLKITTLEYRNEEKIEIEIERNAIHNGRNEIRLQTDTWSPVNYGEKDDRQLGISINHIEVTNVTCNN